MWRCLRHPSFSGTPQTFSKKMVHRSSPVNSDTSRVTATGKAPLAYLLHGRPQAGCVGNLLVDRARCRAFTQGRSVGAAPRLSVEAGDAVPVVFRSRGWCDRRAGEAVVVGPRGLECRSPTKRRSRSATAMDEHEQCAAARSPSMESGSAALARKVECRSCGTRGTLAVWKCG